MNGHSINATGKMFVHYFTLAQVLRMFPVSWGHTMNIDYCHLLFPLKQAQNAHSNCPLAVVFVVCSKHNFSNTKLILAFVVTNSIMMVWFVWAFIVLAKLVLSLYS